MNSRLQMAWSRISITCHRHPGWGVFRTASATSAGDFGFVGCVEWRFAILSKQERQALPQGEGLLSLQTSPSLFCLSMQPHWSPPKVSSPSHTLCPRILCVGVVSLPSYTHVKTRGSCGTAFLALFSSLLFQAWSLTEPGAWHLGWTAWPASPWDPPVTVLSAQGLQCYPVQCCRDPGVPCATMPSLLY